MPAARSAATPAENQGHERPAVRALAWVGLKLHGYDRVEIRMDPRNLRSAAVPGRLGFALEATLPRRATALTGLHDVLVWSLYREQAMNLLVDESTKIEAWDLLDRRLR